MNTSTNITVQEERLATVLDSIQDVKGKNIIQLDLRELDDRPADFFFICEGESTTQVNAIANRVQQRMKEDLGEFPKSTSGSRNATWICLDYFDTVIHVFHPETRQFYELEDLWSDAVTTTHDTL